MQSNRTRRLPVLRAAGLAAVAWMSAVLAKPAPADDAPAWELRADAALVDPKAHLRDGTTYLPGDDVYSEPDLDTDTSVPAPVLRLGLHLGGHRLALSGWRLEAEGRGTFPETKAVGGSIVPAGTTVDSTLSWSSGRLQYLYSLPLWARWEDGVEDGRLTGGYRQFLSLDFGAAIDRTTFRSEIDFPGGTETMSLVGLFPTPLVGFEVRPFGTEVLSIHGLAGGFNFLRIPNGDTTVLDPLEYRIALRGAWDGFFAEAGYYLYHVHFERDRDESEEDVVHMRMRSVYLGAGVRF